MRSHEMSIPPLENLELLHRGQPAGQRLDDKIKWCIEFLTEYEYKVIKQ